MYETTRIFRPSGPFAALFGKPYGPNAVASPALTSSPLSTLFHTLSIPPRDVLLAHKRKRPVPPPAS
ncbi:Putative exported protein (fragment) [Pseudomonas sp. JV241A]